MPGFDLVGRSALVTGAASGLGRHFTLTLARAGARVAAAGRDLQALTGLVDEIESLDGRAVPLLLDVCDGESVRKTVQAAETELGPIGILVNNAGLVVCKSAMEQSESDWDLVIDTNLKGAWSMAQETARRMIHHGHGGSIVNIASVLGMKAEKQLIGYAASKAGLLQLTRVLALELARHRIRVNAICPGYFPTVMTKDHLEGAKKEGLIARIPQRRLGECADLDGPLMLLASDAGAYMTGSVIVVDGGLSL
jgi:NAD(P)-dependent dehydrogenase (short-subunit alcohol dehydrogenase family)